MANYKNFPLSELYEKYLGKIVTNSPISISESKVDNNINININVNQLTMNTVNHVELLKKATFNELKDSLITALLNFYETDNAEKTALQLEVKVII